MLARDGHGGRVARRGARRDMAPDPASRVRSEVDGPVDGHIDADSTAKLEHSSPFALTTPKPSADCGE